MDAFTLKNLRGADAFPGGGDLDQHPFPANPALLVKFDEFFRLGHQRRGVKGQVRVGFGGNAAGNDL